ncbi:hypothetical protein MLD38_015223 [Melastoma candidum]|uniref:Uncharacterized protein n=1 Tax=Melastoma candidum TaxID=119954 RepID=A0ACB9REP2_9MYRT|nr:hypothetical protein MLD38_015223 [Melastoma candidum]
MIEWKGGQKEKTGRGQKCETGAGNKKMQRENVNDRRTNRDAIPHPHPCDVFLSSSFTFHSRMPACAEPLSTFTNTGIASKASQSPMFPPSAPSEEILCSLIHGAPLLHIHIQ